MELRERILAAARRLAEEKPLDKVTLTEVARLAGVSLPTARRHVGGKSGLRALLSAEGSAERNPDTRTRILSSAARAFARHGYAETTLDDVGAEAGLTKGAVYWHFASKTDLYLALLEQRVRQQGLALGDLIEAAAGSVNREQGLAALLALQLAQAYADPDRPRLAQEFLGRSWDPEVRGRLAVIYREGYEKLSGFLHGLQQAGMLAPDVDPFILSVFFDALLTGLVRAWLIDPEHVDPLNWTPALARILWKGVAPQ